jgi:hypothetical protein
MGAFQSLATKRLEENGIADPQPGTWYPWQNYLDAFREIAERIGPTTVERIGGAIPDNAGVPESFDTVEEALRAIQGAYTASHRNGDIGYYDVRVTSERSVEIECRNPYPTELDRGLIKAMAKRGESGSGRVDVKLDETKPQRAQGADSDTFIVTW